MRACQSEALPGKLSRGGLDYSVSSAAIHPSPPFFPKINFENSFQSLSISIQHLFKFAANNQFFEL